VATLTVGLTTLKKEYMDNTGSKDLLAYLITQSSSGAKNWFGFQQQKIMGINLAYEIAKNHASQMSPYEVTDYVMRLNDSIYKKLIKGESDEQASR
jgi:hypothetical protein